MNRRRNAILSAIAAALVLIVSATATGQIRIANYNIAQLQGDHNALEDVLIALHDDDKPGFAVPVSVFIFQEVTSANIGTLTSLVNAAAPNGVTYALATYTNTDEDDYAGAQALFYRSDQLSEVPGTHIDLYTGAGRDSDRWKLQLDDYSSTEASFYVYSMHLKAGNDPSDISQRASGSNLIRTNGASLTAGSHIIYAGDFNVDDNGEDAYWNFLDPGFGQAFDPLGTSSWAGSGGAIKHTQSPRAFGSGGLIGGGMDDRFDFQLPSLTLNDGDGISIITGTYRTVANDGNHYDTSVNNGNNTYFGLDIARSNALADDCFAASDHLPLLCDYTLPAVMSSWTDITDFGRVIVDANVEVQLLVSNDADVVVSSGADLLTFNVQTTGDMLGSVNGQVNALAPPASFFFPADTATVGPFSGTIDVSSSDEAVENAADSHEITGDVLRHAKPSFSDTADENDIDIMATFAPNTGVYDLEALIWNLDHDALQALLDIDSITGLTAPLAFTGIPPSGIAEAGETLPFAVDTTGLAEGLVDQTATIHTSDEDLPGESTHSLTINFAITIEAEPCPADINGDALVDVSDLLALLAAWGPCPSPCGPDTNGDGAVNVTDLLTVLAAWGSCP